MKISKSSSRTRACDKAFNMFYNERRDSNNNIILKFSKLRSRRVNIIFTLMKSVSINSSNLIVNNIFLLLFACDNDMRALY